ncbi:MAG: DUF1013 domain-containing protein [Rickettsiales bacterium]|jgi:hypothetical protein|nr:DUF1013 domain-containing protein [Rickettsiales bacterium]
MTEKILMPKSTAVWLIDNTALSFAQIAAFCSMHPLEVQALADRDEEEYVVGFSPILNNMITWEDVRRCEADPNARLTVSDSLEGFIKQSRKVKSRYTPMALRAGRPDAILWLVKNHPELSDAQICKLVRTTKNTVESIRSRTHKAMADLTPKSPILLEICTQADLQAAIDAADKKTAKAD